MYTAVFEKVFKQFTVQYEFKSLTADKELPEEVTALLPKDPAGDGNVKFTGTWEFTPKDPDPLPSTGGMGTHLFIIVGAARERPAGDRWPRGPNNVVPRDEKSKTCEESGANRTGRFSEARFAPPSPLGLIVPSRGAKSSHKSRAGA